MRGERSAAAALEHFARTDRSRLLAILAAEWRDLDLAEEAVSIALASAVERWPAEGVPRSPEGWLLAVARRRAIDHARKAGVAKAHAANAVDEGSSHLLVPAVEPLLPDRRLELMLACAHPAIDERSRAPLMLNVILGMDSARIAAAFLVSPAAMAQRLVRAKAKIKLSGIRFERPAPEDMATRSGAVLHAIYAAYTCDWSAGIGRGHDARDTLASEAIWLGTLLVELMPAEPEALGLLSLMLHLEARRGASRTSEGSFVPLDEQRPDLWDHRSIDQADALLVRAAEHRSAGRFQLEAAIQSAHAHRRAIGVTDWIAVERLYRQLERITGSPVVAINRALVVARIAGAGDALALLDEIAGHPGVKSYQPYWVAKAEVLAMGSDRNAASSAYDRAIELTEHEALRRHLASRREEAGC